MLDVQNLFVSFPGKPILQNVSLSIPTGQVTVLLGPNGCGKTTFLKALCGILPVKGGSAFLDGQELLSLPQRERARRVAYLAQGRQIPDITVQRLVLHGRFPYLSYPRRYRSQDYAAAQAAMAQMDLEALADTPLDQLSGGQRQKVYIAMALAQDTPVVLLDEPITYLDVAHQFQLLSQAKALSQQGKTVVMVVHDIPAAMGVADHIVLMDRGQIVFQGTPEALYASGAVTGVFGMKLRRVQSEKRWVYYCEEG